MRNAIVIWLFALGLPGLAQQKLSLKECLQTGIENNLSLRASRNEVLKGKDNLSENRAKLLPQINAVASFNDNFNPPVSVTDGSAYGRPYNVTHTLQYNAAGGLQLQMPLYSQMALTALDITKTVNQLNELAYGKAREDLMVQIAKTYYLLQNTKEQLGILEENIKRFESLKEISQAFYDNQMALEVDLKRINVRLESTRIQAENVREVIAEQFNMLKYILDLPAEAEIDVEEPLVDELSQAEASGLSDGLYELQLLEAKTVLADKQVKLARDGYLPTLALTGNLMFTAFSDKVKYWFRDSEANHWYHSNGIGLALRVPLFDGLEKRAKVRKAKRDAETARMGYDNALKGLQTQYVNVLKDQANNRRNYIRQHDNYQLAEDVYDVTYDRYREGIASMTEVLQDQMGMSEAQNGYLTAHFNYQVSNLTLLKLTGRLEELLK